VKKRDDISSLISKVMSNVQSAKERGIVDVIAFCEDPRFLDFKGQSLELWPMQKIVLKMFYRGSEGNEALKLDETEIEILRKIAEEEELDYKDEAGGFSQVIDKYNRGAQFSHMLLIMGRRSSKTMMVSIIAAYEAYKLLEAPDGNPQKKYKIAVFYRQDQQRREHKGQDIYPYRHRQGREREKGAVWSEHLAAWVNHLDERTFQFGNAARTRDDSRPVRRVRALRDVQR
jgi:hypothetical protein